MSERLPIIVYGDSIAIGEKELGGDFTKISKDRVLSNRLGIPEDIPLRVRDFIWKKFIAFLKQEANSSIAEIASEIFLDTAIEKFKLEFFIEYDDSLSIKNLPEVTIFRQGKESNKQFAEFIRQAKEKGCSFFHWQGADGSYYILMIKQEETNDTKEEEETKRKTSLLDQEANFYPITNLTDFKAFLQEKFLATDNNININLVKDFLLHLEQAIAKQSGITGLEIYIQEGSDPITPEKKVMGIAISINVKRSGPKDNLKVISYLNNQEFLQEQYTKWFALKQKSSEAKEDLLKEVKIEVSVEQKQYFDLNFFDLSSFSTIERYLNRGPQQAQKFVDKLETTLKDSYDIPGFRLELIKTLDPKTKQTKYYLYIHFNKDRYQGSIEDIKRYIETQLTSKAFDIASQAISETIQGKTEKQQATSEEKKPGRTITITEDSLLTGLYRLAKSSIKNPDLDIRTAELSKSFITQAVRLVRDFLGLDRNSLHFNENNFSIYINAPANIEEEFIIYLLNDPNSIKRVREIIMDNPIILVSIISSQQRDAPNYLSSKDFNFLTIDPYILLQQPIVIRYMLYLLVSGEQPNSNNFKKFLEKDKKIVFTITIKNKEFKVPIDPDKLIPVLKRLGIQSTIDIGGEKRGANPITTYQELIDTQTMGNLLQSIKEKLETYIQDKKGHINISQQEIENIVLNFLDKILTANA